jgi:putative peptidoglycan lipid II flippase
MDPGIRRVLILMVPSVIAASAVQVNVLVNSRFASYVGSEAVTWLNSAFRLMQLPIGVFGVAVATITLPVISRIAADADTSRFGPTLGRALRLAVFFTLPSAVGLFFLAHPIVGLIYEHGEFVANDTFQTALALQLYALGLVAYSCVKVLSPAFYAIDRKWTPMLVSSGAVVLNLGLNYHFMFHLGLGHCGLALSTAICAVLDLTTLYLLMLRPAKTLETPRLLLTLVRCGLASIPLGLVCWTGHSLFSSLFPHPLFWQKAVGLLTIIAAASAAYGILSMLLGVEETKEALAIIRRKLAGKTTAL